MTVEEKILARIRGILAADATIKGYVGVRVYESHPSTIEQPEFPSISLFIVNSRPVFAAGGVVAAELQIDIWFTETATHADLRACHERIRALLHRQSLTDTTLDLKGSAVELVAGQILHEQDTRLRHLPIRYEVRAL